MAAPPPLPSHDQLSKSAGQRPISSHEFTFNPASRDDFQVNHLPLERITVVALEQAAAAPFAVRAEFATGA
jgi:hypothetical protein